MVRRHPLIARSAQPQVEALLRQFPTVALLGSYQAGKTTLARALARARGRAAVYLDLEMPSDLARLADPEHYLASQEGALVILDEIHRLPGRLLSGPICSATFHRSGHAFRPRRCAASGPCWRTSRGNSSTIRVSPRASR